MNNHTREIAGIIIGASAVMLIYKGFISEALYILLPTMAFFIGEKNGERKTPTD